MRINMNHVSGPCFALANNGECKALRRTHRNCGTPNCPFYKPAECKDWVRVENVWGKWLMPPEDVYGEKKRH